MTVPIHWVIAAGVLWLVTLAGAVYWQRRCHRVAEHARRFSRRADAYFADPSERNKALLEGEQLNCDEAILGLWN